MLHLPFERVQDLLPVINQREQKLYQAHFELLQEWNKKVALVSRKSIEFSFSNHYADSIQIAEFAHAFDKWKAAYDLGSGAGFPGVIYAIRYPKTQVTLFERIGKKRAFLEESVRALSLENVRIEAEWLNQKVRGLVFARAVTPRTELLKFFERRLSSESVVILNSGGELIASPMSSSFKVLDSRLYQLPENSGARKVDAVEFVPRETK